MDSITRSLVEFSLAVRAKDLPQIAIDEVRRRLIDSFGCALVGLDSPPVAALCRLLEGREVDGGCLVWGSDKRTTPEMAALINATAIRYLDFNDHTLGGHPSDNIPSVIAACEIADRDIGDLIAGLIVSYEIFGELGKLLVRDGGWDLGTTGVVASACGAGRALGLGPDELANAIGIATISNVALRKSRRGELSMWKGVATPYAAQCGLMAACMAKGGLTGPHDAFEGEDGFFEQVHGPFTIDELDDPRKPQHIFRASYKYWPVEFNAQLGVWLGLEIRNKFPFDQIVSIDVQTNEWTWMETARESEKWAPRTRETADHSLPYALAVALVEGEVSIEHFTLEALENPEYQAVIKKLSINPADDLTVRFPCDYEMRADVTTDAQEVVRVQVSEPLGRYTNPLTDEDIQSKFRKLSECSQTSAAGEAVLSNLIRLEEMKGVRALLEPLIVGP